VKFDSKPSYNKIRSAEIFYDSCRIPYMYVIYRKGKQKKYGNSLVFNEYWNLNVFRAFCI